jgi:hypothetical protein
MTLMKAWSQGQGRLKDVQSLLDIMKEAGFLGMADGITTQEEYVSALSAAAATLESGVLRPIIVGREPPL